MTFSDRLDALLFSMLSFRSAILIYASLLLVACSQGTLESKLPFPIAIPSSTIIATKYQNIKHDLSPLPAYRFRIQIPKDWKTLDTFISQEPKPNQLADVAVFRQSGAWIHDALAPINGEISVSVMNVSGSTLSPADWLENTLQKNAKGFKMIQKRLSPSSFGEVPDLLMTYTSGKDVLVSRMMAFRLDDKIFIITGSDTAEEYPENADTFNVAISSFRLDRIEKTTP